MKEKVKQFVEDHKVEVITVSIWGAGFVTGMIFHKIIGPKWTPVTESIKVLDYDITEHELAIVNDVFHSLVENGYKVCKKA